MVDSECLLLQLDMMVNLHSLDLLGLLLAVAAVEFPLGVLVELVVLVLAV